MPKYYSGKADTVTPNLTPIKAIKKFIIIFDIKLTESPPIYYAWNPKRQPKWIETRYGWIPEKPYFTVDYDNKNREWYVGYIVTPEDRKFATIDDITGRVDIKNVDHK